jgi:uncharacterized protein
MDYAGMKFFIAGGSGFVGRHLCEHLLAAGHTATIVGRRRRSPLPEHPQLHYLSADTTQPGAWQDAVQHHPVVINLAGASIFKYWTERYKRELYDSRILTTRNLVAALPRNHPVFCSTSAVGYYGNRDEDILTEEEPPGNDFLATLSVDWEREARMAEDKAARVILTRFGIILGESGGALPLMVSAFRKYVGGALGSGRQWFPWIHIRDLLDAYQFVFDHPDVAGVVNFCAPKPVRNRELTHTLARKLNRPAVLSPPAFGIKLVMGELGASLLNSQRVLPAKLQKFGFTFQFPTIDTALDDLING